MVGVGIPCKRPISWTTVTSGSISIGPAALKILQHRGLVRADLARALDPALDIDAEPDALLVGDLFRFEHHGLRDRARARIGGDDVEGGVGQRADRD